MNDIDNVLRLAMIAATVANLISCVYYVIRMRRPDRLMEAMALWLTADPRYNYLAQVLEKHPDGKTTQGRRWRGTSDGCRKRSLTCLWRCSTQMQLWPECCPVPATGKNREAARSRPLRRAR